MAALAEAAPGIGGQRRLVGRERDDLDREDVQQVVELRLPRGAET